MEQSRCILLTAVVNGLLRNLNRRIDLGRDAERSEKSLVGAPEPRFNNAGLLAQLHSMLPTLLLLGKGRIVEALILIVGIIAKTIFEVVLEMGIEVLPEPCALIVGGLDAIVHHVGNGLEVAIFVGQRPSNEGALSFEMHGMELHGTTSQMLDGLKELVEALGRVASTSMTANP